MDLPNPIIRSINPNNKIRIISRLIILKVLFPFLNPLIEKIIEDNESNGIPIAKNGTLDGERRKNILNLNKPIVNDINSYTNQA